MSPKNSNVINKNLKFLNKELKDKNLYPFYKKFEKSLKIKKNFIVAVSGGPDSLCLAFLSKVYSLKNKLNSRYFIIDHALRAESKNEAILTKKRLKKVFINAKILTWKGKKPKNNIQSIARSKRYELLLNQCKNSNIKHILLGHHSDDLLENFLIRMLRGSGLRGLTSFGSSNTNGNIKLLRPLTVFDKNQLVLFTKKIFGKYIQDPSNFDEKFKRIKIRNLLGSLKSEGFDKKKFLLTVQNLKSSDKTIKHYVQENLLNNSFYNVKKQSIILNSNFLKCTDEVAFRSFSECLREISKNYYFARGKKIERVLYEIKNKKDYKTTIGGCLVRKIEKTIIICKEK